MAKFMGESIKSRYRPSFPKKYKGNPNNINVEVVGRENSVLGVT